MNEIGKRALLPTGLFVVVALSWAGSTRRVRNCLQTLQARHREVVRERGRLLVIAEVGDGERSFENGPPWLLTPDHVQSFVSHDVSVVDRDVTDSSLDGAASYITTFDR